jgi:hypothetical protein
MDFYFIRDRGYHGTEGMEHYTPRIDKGHVMILNKMDIETPEFVK